MAKQTDSVVVLGSCRTGMTNSLVWDGANVIINFPEPIDVQAGDKLVVSLRKAASRTLRAVVLKVSPKPEG